MSVYVNGVRVTMSSPESGGQRIDNIFYEDGILIIIVDDIRHTLKIDKPAGNPNA